MTTTADVQRGAPTPSWPGQLRARISPRADFAMRRIGRLVVSLLVVVLAAFFLVHLVPGDPVRAALGPTAPASLVEATRIELGLNQPVPQQLVNYLAGLLRGDLGTSIQSGLSVGDTIASRFPTTLTLAALGFVVAMLGALPIGMGAALIARSGRGGTANSAVSGALGVIIAIPEFVLAVGLISVFSMWLTILPPAGWGEPRNVVLPVLALALGAMAYLARIVQVEMIKVLDSTYIATAKAKRLPHRVILMRHALPNIITATLTVGGLILSGLVAGTVIIETIFAIPGAGSSLISAIGSKDYPMIQGMVLVYAFSVLAVNLVVDLILLTVDPRTTIAEG
ncbi:ABC transporter permease [Microbacterium sp. zg.Y909]|uniref:ABC transporter permease n=1 Tax=Microbacterium sp. zg.Y909 TaxID=2969413 RepID=UPI00214CEA88|nr:ABC transporter permease [Microbacterium sp. zg.Y909]MCR2824782.1 ABC transporter permease [Microbacterium sp. zg.Y909]